MWKRILVPTDFSAGSKRALDYACELARPYGALVEVLHVWTAGTYAGPEMMLHFPGEQQQTLAQFSDERARRELEELLKEAEHPGVVKGRIERGDPAAAILRAAAEGYDLVVMATHGRTGLGHLLLGSVAEKVLRHSSCPVLTLRMPSTG